MLALAALLAFPGAGSPAPAESWTLTFTSDLTGTMTGPLGAVRVRIQATGSAALTLDQSGRISGAGTLSGTITTTAPPNPAVTISPQICHGPVTVSGRRQGEALVFGFSHGAVPCKGTITVVTPAETRTEPNDTDLDPEYLAPGDTSMIERSNGASSTVKIDVTGGGTSMTGTTRFALSGGTAVQKEPALPKGEFPATPNPWTLEMDLSMAMTVKAQGMAGTSKTTMEGRAEFPLPLGDGQALGDGPFTMQSTTVWTAPRSVTSVLTGRGKLLLDGRIANDVLTFVPRAKLESSRIDQGPPEMRGAAEMGAGLWLFNTDEKVRIPVENGASVAQDFSGSEAGVSYTARVTWRLRGVKKERWQVTMNEWDTVYTGSQTAAAGLRVRSRVTIVVEIENGQYKTGKGTAAIVAVAPHAHPPGVYACKAAATTIGGLTRMTPFIEKPSFPVTGAKTGKQLVLDLYFPKKTTDDLGFWAAYQCTLNEAEGAKKIANWDLRKSSLRKTILDRHFEPFPFRITVMLVDGWSVSKGTAQSINYETIQVKRIK